MNTLYLQGWYKHILSTVIYFFWFDFPDKLYISIYTNRTECKFRKKASDFLVRWLGILTSGKMEKQGGNVLAQRYVSILLWKVPVYKGFQGLVKNVKYGFKPKKEQRIICCPVGVIYPASVFNITFNFFFVPVLSGFGTFFIINRKKYWHYDFKNIFLLN